jgi:hypothetical protein
MRKEVDAIKRRFT